MSGDDQPVLSKAIRAILEKGHAAPNYSDVLDAVRKANSDFFQDPTFGMNKKDSILLLAQANYVKDVMFTQRGYEDPKGDEAMNRMLYHNALQGKCHELRRDRTSRFSRMGDVRIFHVTHDFVAQTHAIVAGMMSEEPEAGTGFSR